MADRARRCYRNFAPIIAPTVGLFGAGLFVAVSLLSALHPQLVERDPLHLHVVIGGTRIEQARALAAHFRGSAADRPAPSQDKTHEFCSAGHAAVANVLSIRGGEPTGTRVFSVSGAIATGSAAALRPAVPPAIRFSMQPELPARILTPSVPDPPPRVS